jgi:hypothetical protein
MFDAREENTLCLIHNITSGHGSKKYVDSIADPQAVMYISHCCVAF